MGRNTHNAARTQNQRVYLTFLGGGAFGTLVPMNDVAALARAMTEALAGPRNEERQRARAAEFSAERAVEAYWQAMFP